MYLCSWLLPYAYLFVISVSAFYPYSPSESSPDGAKARNGQSQTRSPRLLEGKSEFGGAKSIKLSMSRRAPPTHAHPHDWSGVELATMARGLRVNRRDGDSQEASTPVKRTNKHDIVTAAQPTQSNSVAIDQDGTDYSYMTAVRFGASGKVMYMLVDTGAANTWVMGSDCTSEPCTTHNSFGAKDSITLRTTDYKFSLSYGSGTVSGVIVNDTVKMADFSFPLSFGSASIVSNEFSSYPMDGILGLGRSASSAMPFPTVMEAIDHSNVLQKNLLGINLQRNGDGSTDGVLNFGAPDVTKYAGDLSYTSTVKGGELWEIPVDDASVNGAKCRFSGKTAIIDTGTSFMLLPPADAQRLHKLIPHSQQDGEVFNIPCSSSLPVQITISSITYSISPKDYVGKPIAGGNLCSSNIVGKETFGPDRWLVGDVFLKNVYTVFDFDLGRIGFGIKITFSQSSTSRIAASTTKSTSLSTKSIIQLTPSPTMILTESPPSMSTTAATKASNATSKDPNASPSSQSPIASSPSATTSNANSSIRRLLPLTLPILASALGILQFFP